MVGQVLTGMGGVGKTQLAARHARDAWRSGRLDLLVWVTATSRQAVVDGLAEAAQTLLGADREDPERAARAFLAWLEPKPAPEAPRWLVVLDDVTDPADLTGLWPPDSPTGRTVVTTRSRDAALTGRGRRQVTVGVFTEEESEGYLTTALAAHDREPLRELMALGSALGWLPLAMSQATAYVVDAGITCATYRARLADRAQRLADLHPTALPDDQTTGVAAAWTLSLDRADHHAPVGLARPMLQLASMLDPNGIPEAVLTGAPALNWLAQEAPSQDTVSSDDAVRTLRVLHRLSLLDHSPRTPRRAVRVHRLVQRAVRDTLTEAEQDALARVAADGLVEAWPEVERDTELAQSLRANTAAVIGVAEKALYEPASHVVLHRYGRSLGMAGQVSDAIAYYANVVRVSHTLLGPAHRHTLFNRAVLANWYGRAGDAAGTAAALTDVLNDMEHLLGPGHPYTHLVRPLLALWQRAAGDGTAAAALGEWLESPHLKVSPDDPLTFAIRSDLAHQEGGTGDPSSAVATYVELLADATRVLGPDHDQTLAIRGHLAEWQGRAGAPSGAVAAYEALYEDYARVLGPEHPHTFLLRARLANWLGVDSSAAAAVTALTSVLDDMVKVLDPEHRDLLLVRERLAHWQAKSATDRTR
ncbi:tetratricopeptide repeat protein [Streptomyces sp. NPDC008079]|uniref:DUF7779 domain-containing protein n=1 Tax=Streptomyces sp. NPDC008079 TaxID=3364806 RepID=UPI0036ED4BB4